jgi:AraC-like DNA-binding protein
MSSGQTYTDRQYMITGDFEFFHYKDDTAIEVDFHYHDFYEVFIFISGKVQYMIEGNSYALRPGDIILINNKEIHKPVVDPKEPYERIVIWIDADYIKKISTEKSNLLLCFETTSKRKYNLLRPGAETSGQIKHIISKLGKAREGKSFGADILRTLYLQELIVFLNRAYFDTREEEIEIDISNNQKINDIIQYINLNLHQELTLEQISAKFYISKFHLLREFKKNTGYTIHQYILKKRLILSRILLKENMKTTEILMKCGFKDYSNFIRAFKKKYGISPKKFHKQ